VSEDSNVENIGSIMDKAARMSAALTEPCWEGAGEKPGIEIWRVHNERTEQGSSVLVVVVVVVMVVQ
jgi:hypothetical protein